jgi:hypothetical protein
MFNPYNQILHRTYQERLNNEINIRENIFKAITDYKKIETDSSIYPLDQRSEFNIRFPLAGYRSFPTLQLADYMSSIDNYKYNGNLFTLRYVDNIEKYSEVLYLDPNDNGQVWFLIISPELKEVDEIKKYSTIDLTTGIVSNLMN